MKDASYEIRVGYIMALEGLKLDNELIISHDEIKPFDDDSMTYIVVSGQTFTDTSAKCGFATDHAISLNIVTKFKLGYGTKKKSEDISNLVLARLIPESGDTLIVTPNFHIWNTKLTMAKTVVDETTERIITKILTFRHEINQI
ncbi:hypothetical protein ORI89_07510 [Sphingobacterium sp. UT-1RO-CII-1]|uniref:hypothetical protein n=1 Tax=Sphingobacterium sp. UT-1RO-CII-1 TaxID=2995225 RepID=UPI002279F620|nr:hypothetical protein [Sphingobacterium sp. UT-1RO-CII-1]MCY4779492.1 hypothetical protein [Sphingobacterium sp. UT-1RO-CII-1]